MYEILAESALCQIDVIVAAIFLLWLKNQDAAANLHTGTGN